MKSKSIATQHSVYYSPEKQLFKAIQVRSLDRIKQLVSSGVDVNAINDKGATVLYIAVTTKQYDVVQFLLNNGANPNTIVQSEYSPLSHALGFVNPKIAELLIENGANIKDKLHTGETPLHKAVRNGHITIAKQILYHGADIESLSDDGLTLTPLDIATLNMHSGMIKLLINHGANITDQNLTDINTQPINAEDITISSLVICAKIFDAAYGEQKDELCDFIDILGDSYNKLNQMDRNILCERLLYRAFWNKELSLEEITTVISTLLEKINYLSDIIEEELFIFEDILNYKNIISSISLQNESGNVPSLLRTIINFLKDNKLWNYELETKICSDIISKADTFESFDTLLEKFNIVLTQEDSPSNEEAFLASTSASYLSLVGQNEILHYIDFTERVYA